MTDIEKARQLFRDAGLDFPTIPKELAAQLKERGRWFFSSRQIDMSPYNLEHYVHEVERAEVKDYAVLSHSGHGVNSYAIQYYPTLCRAAWLVRQHSVGGHRFLPVFRTSSGGCFRRS